MSTCLDPVSSSRSALTHSQLDGLVRTHAARLTNFVRRRVGNPADVEDIVQDTLLEALRCMDCFQGNSKPETWLFGIALNLTRNHYKRAKVRDIYSDVETEDVASDHADDPSEIAEYRERVFRVAHAVEAMPGDTHLLLQLIFDDHLSYKQTADRLGVPVGTVRSRISRARSVLRQHADGASRPCGTVDHFEDEAEPVTGRGRAAPSAPRRAASRFALSA